MAAPTSFMIVMSFSKNFIHAAHCYLNITKSGWQMSASCILFAGSQLAVKTAADDNTDNRCTPANACAVRCRGYRGGGIHYLWHAA